MIALTVALATAAATNDANAQAGERSWRRSERPPETPQRYALEFRIGPYAPKIDEDFRGGARPPYESVFGTDRRVAVGLEFDWQAFRIPMVGTLGPGVGWNYTHMSSDALFASGQPSAEKTTLGIMPMYGVAVLRIDVLARETPIPIVAYGKAGLGYGLWWSGNDEGTQLRGHSWGTQLAVGGMFLLDALDSHSAAELDNETGINNSYFFVEWMDARLGNLSSSTDRSVLRIGASTWVMGLALEM